MTTSGEIAPQTGSAVLGAGPVWTTRKRYGVLGGVLEAPFEFPELPAARSSRPDWTLRVGNQAPDAQNAVWLGERRLHAELYRLWQIGDGFRLEYSLAGTFDIAPGRGTIAWYPRPEPQMELVRAIVLGPALSLLLEAQGLLCLHGSAVELDGAAVAFLGPKYHGKSTLATALTASGARLVSDDVLAICPGPPARLRAGVPSVRLWEDSVQRLRVEDLCTTVIPGIKTTAAGFAARAYTGRDVPLTAIYLLAPVTGEVPAVSTPGWRTRLRGTRAAVALAHQTKLPDALIGGSHAGQQLRACATLAGTVPVWTLSTVRDLALLNALVDRVVDWHRMDLRSSGPGEGR